MLLLSTGSLLHTILCLLQVGVNHKSYSCLIHVSKDVKSNVYFKEFRTKENRRLYKKVLYKQEAS